MPYIINKTDGSVLTTVGDGTINNNITSLTLIGKNYDKYGELINENFVRLLENFANNSSPSNPLAGQIWWDTFNTQLKVYTGSEFKSVAKLTSATAQPSNNKIGDLWWDTTNGQLKIYNGTSFTTIGPNSSLEFGSTGATPEELLDVAAEPHLVVSLFSGSTRVAVVSEDAEFVPVPPLPGFSSIKPGINLASGFTLVGTADNADTLDGLNSTDFLRANANTTTSGTFGVLNDTGIAVGADSDFRVSITGANVLVENQTTNGNLNFKVAGNASPAISINGSTGAATVLADPITALGVATKSYVDNIAVSGNALSRSGTNTITGVITPDTNGTRNFGSLSNRFATVFATSFDGTSLNAGGTVTANTAVASDTISERTSGAGVTADGVLLKDNDVQADEVRTDTISEKTGGAGITISNTTNFSAGSGSLRIGGSITRFESAEFNVPAYPGGVVTVNHGGPRKPDILRVVLRRNVSLAASGEIIDNSYSAGDEVSLTDCVVSSNQVTTIWSNATQCGFASFLYPPNIARKDGTYNGNITPAYWKVVFYAIWL